VENIPIISGNFVCQPAMKLLGIDVNIEDFPGADELGNCGFFIDIHTYPLSDEQIVYLVDPLLGFNFNRRVVLVTCDSGLVGRVLQGHVQSNYQGEGGEKWVFVSSIDADLCSCEETKRIFAHHSPTHVIHLAAKLIG